MRVLDRADRSWLGGLWPLWPAPIQPGIYEIGTASPDLPVVVCPNSRRALRQLGEADLRVIVTPSGGLDLNAALAVGAITAETLLNSLIAALPEIGDAGIVLPAPLFELIAPSARRSLGERKIIAGPAEIAGLLAFVAGGARGEAKSRPARRLWVVHRLRWAALAGLGQTLLLSPPLVVFGLTTWLIGLSLFWAVLLSLALLWPLVPVKAGWLKGAIVGVLAAAAMGIGEWLMAGSWGGLSSLIKPICLALLGLWAGVILPGAK